ncbi:MAG: hypothetical protein JWN13_4987 [Betaproteobacteria bacterium]|jgi:hypothetical protein|nr:hypothetical protein [Betaproteobacteria bacterium]
MVNAEACFSPDYETARTRFRESATHAGAALHAIGLPTRGPRGEALCIDIAWIGSPHPRNVFLHTTGLHGVEAFTGAAVQLALLNAPPVPGSEDALVLVHVLNPYGMAWLRRTNENNVDLNRNFLVNGERFAGAPELYGVLDPLLNPTSAPAHDGFRVRAPAIAVKLGFHQVKHAIAEGQYEYEQGLFFGGRELQPGARMFSAWLQQHLSDADYVFGVDLHTGLGRRGTDTWLSSSTDTATAPATLSSALGRELVDPARPSVAYTVRGGYGAALRHLLPRAKIDFILQEIGTYPPLAILHALREENRWHFYGDGSIVHPAKLRLREVLCPAAGDWRRRAVTRGLTLACAAARWTFSRKG